MCLYYKNKTTKAQIHHTLRIKRRFGIVFVFVIYWEAYFIMSQAVKKIIVVGGGTGGATREPLPGAFPARVLPDLRGRLRW